MYVGGCGPPLGWGRAERGTNRVHVSAWGAGQPAGRPWTESGEEKTGETREREREGELKRELGGLRNIAP